MAEYTYSNLPKPLFSHATTTGIVEVSPERKQRGLEATEHIFLFIVREVIVSISLKIAFALFTCVFRCPLDTPWRTQRLATESEDPG